MDRIPGEQSGFIWFYFGFIFLPFSSLTSLEFQRLIMHVDLRVHIAEHSICSWSF